jgi:hypothetical protein
VYIVYLIHAVLNNVIYARVFAERKASREINFLPRLAKPIIQV